MSNQINKITKLYSFLQKEHGPPSGQWRLWCKKSKTIADREEIIIGAILTQNTNWSNVSKAMGQLKDKRAVNLVRIQDLGIRRLKAMIKPAGFFNSKAQYLKNIVDFVLSYGGVRKMMSMDFEKLRPEILKVKGVGPETADSILNYALDLPVFVIDEYTRRIVKKFKITKKVDYNFLQNLFQNNIRKDFRLYQDFHALIVIYNKAPFTRHLARLARLSC